MKPDVLFWFYKDFPTCQARLQSLRALNPDVRIFALYGGPLSGEATAKRYLHDLVDDFYTFTEDRPSHWKWRHGDQLITTWYRDRGCYLDWKNIFIMQWDMLILAPLEDLFLGLQPDEILLSGFTSAEEVSEWWPWISNYKSEFLEFRDMLREKFQYEGELFACLFIVVCLPRLFLEKYLTAQHPEIGFLEYKIPTMARLFDIPVCTEHHFNPWWKANPATKNAPRHQRALNAVGQEVPISVIAKELANADGQRLFHPISNTLPRWIENPLIVQLLVSARIPALSEFNYQVVEALKRSAKSFVRTTLSKVEK